MWRNAETACPKRLPSDQFYIVGFGAPAGFREIEANIGTTIEMIGAPGVT